MRAVVFLYPPDEGREHNGSQREHAADQERRLRAGGLGRFAGRSPGFGGRRADREGRNEDRGSGLRLHCGFDGSDGSRQSRSEAWSRRERRAAVRRIRAGAQHAGGWDERASGGSRQPAVGLPALR